MERGWRLLWRCDAFRLQNAGSLSPAPNVMRLSPNAAKKKKQGKAGDKPRLDGGRPIIPAADETLQVRATSPMPCHAQPFLFLLPQVPNVWHLVASTQLLRHIDATTFRAQRTVGIPRNFNPPQFTVLPK